MQTAHAVCMQTIKNRKAREKTHIPRANVSLSEDTAENKIDEFDRLEAVIRLMLYMHRHPRLNTNKLLKFRGGQRSFYSAKKFLEVSGLLTISVDERNNTVYSLNEKGEKIAEHLTEIEKLLNS